MKRRVVGAPRVDPTQITPARLKQLLQLCHPDRHQNSPLSNDVQQWLLQVKAVLEGK